MQKKPFLITLPCFILMGWLALCAFGLGTAFSAQHDAPFSSPPAGAPSLAPLPADNQTQQPNETGAPQLEPSSPEYTLQPGTQETTNPSLAPLPAENQAQPNANEGAAPLLAPLPDEDATPFLTPVPPASTSQPEEQGDNAIPQAPMDTPSPSLTPMPPGAGSAQVPPHEASTPSSQPVYEDSTGAPLPLANIKNFEAFLTQFMDLPKSDQLHYAEIPFIETLVKIDDKTDIPSDTAKHYASRAELGAHYKELLFFFPSSNILRQEGLVAEPNKVSPTEFEAIIGPTDSSPLATYTFHWRNGCWRVKEIKLFASGV